MTNKNSARWLRDMLRNFDLPMEQYQTALEKGIQALEQQPCSDAISRQAVLDLVVANHTELNGLDVVMYSPFYKDIKQLPPVNPQQKTGHWIRTTDKAGYLVWECDNCGWQQRFNTNFCPDCGARMVES